MQEHVLLASLTAAAWEKKLDAAGLVLPQDELSTKNNIRKWLKSDLFLFFSFREVVKKGQPRN